MRHAWLYILITVFAVAQLCYSAPGDKVAYTTKPQHDRLSSATQGKLNGKLDKTTFGAYTSTHKGGSAVMPNLSSYVRTSRTVNGKALTTNISISANDTGAEPALGNPSIDAECLKSYASGTRYFEACVSRAQAIAVLEEQSATPLNLYPSNRYDKVQTWRDNNNTISGFMLGSGCLVIGSPYTDNFTISSFDPVKGTTATLTAIVPLYLHAADAPTVIKGTSVVFTGFTSYNMVGLVAFARRNIPSGNIRARYTTAIRDIEGNYLYANYSTYYTIP